MSAAPAIPVCPPKRGHDRARTDDSGLLGWKGPASPPPNVTLLLLRACMTLLLAAVITAVCLPLAFYVVAVLGSRDAVRYYYG